MKINKEIIQNTNLQRGYQEFIKFFRCLRIYLEKEMKEYKFTGNIIENNMDYAYFQFTSEKLKVIGLKVVIVFIHQEFSYEVWLSGINRDIQNACFNKLKNKQQEYVLTNDPNCTDYIVKSKISTIPNYDDLDRLLSEFKIEILNFINDIEKILNESL